MCIRDSNSAKPPSEMHVNNTNKNQTIKHLTPSVGVFVLRYVKYLFYTYVYNYCTYLYVNNSYFLHLEYAHRILLLSLIHI